MVGKSLKGAARPSCEAGRHCVVFGENLPIAVPDNRQNMLVQSDRIVEVPFPVDKLFKLGHHSINDLNLCLPLSREQKIFEWRIPFRNHHCRLKTIDNAFPYDCIKSLIHLSHFFPWLLVHRKPPLVSQTQKIS